MKAGEYGLLMVKLQGGFQAANPFIIPLSLPLSNLKISSLYSWTCRYTKKLMNDDFTLIFATLKARN
jgi:hypothetical protein